MTHDSKPGNEAACVSVCVNGSVRALLAIDASCLKRRICELAANFWTVHNAWKAPAENNGKQDAHAEQPT
jgi:hypothetical protein